MVVLALGNMKNPKAVDLLRRLLADEQVAGFAVMALGKSKAKWAPLKGAPDVRPETQSVTPC